MPFINHLIREVVMTDSHFQKIILIMLCIISMALSLDTYTTRQLIKLKQPTPSNINNFISLPAPLLCNITYYTNQICETDNDPEHPAIMQHPVAGQTCAVSHVLTHWLGGKIYIEGIGIRKVNDLTNKRYKLTIDIYTCGKINTKKYCGKKLVTFLGR
jgi:hypothetical protein